MRGFFSGNSTLWENTEKSSEAKGKKSSESEIYRFGAGWFVKCGEKFLASPCSLVYSIKLEVLAG